MVMVNPGCSLLSVTVMWTGASSQWKERTHAEMYKCGGGFVSMELIKPLHFLSWTPTCTYITSSSSITVYSAIRCIYMFISSCTCKWRCRIMVQFALILLHIENFCTKSATSLITLTPLQRMIDNSVKPQKIDIIHHGVSKLTFVCICVQW